MTKNHLIFDRAVMISSTMPSTKYSCSGSPLMFWNGSTAIDGLSGGEWQRRAGARPCRRRAGSSHHPVYSDWPRADLERLLAHVLEGEVELARGILLNPR